MHFQDYNTKVAYLKEAQGSAMKLPVPEIVNALGSHVQSPLANYPAVTPRTDVQHLDDREIATSYLLTLKRAGRGYAWSAMEAANPGLRTFLEDAFRMCSRHAFEVWQRMVKRGTTADARRPGRAGPVSQMYQYVKDPAAVM